MRNDIMIPKKTWDLAKEFFQAYPKETKFNRKITYPYERNDPSVLFFLTKGLVTETQLQASKSTITILESSFIKTQNGDIFALKPGECLGQGAFGKVKIAQNNADEVVAIKIEGVPKDAGRKKRKEKTQKVEQKILTQLGRFKRSVNPNHSRTNQLSFAQSAIWRKHLSKEKNCSRTLNGL